MSRCITLIRTLTAFVFIVVSSNASAYSVGTSYSWAPGDPNYNPGATLHQGTIDTNTLIVGDFLGLSPTQPNTSFGDSGVSVNWDDTYVGGVGNGNTNGDALDGLWAQIIYPGTGWWDLGAAYDTVSVFTSQDHGPYLAEGLEYRLYGSNTLWDTTSLSAQASLTDVYLDGWRAHNPAEDANGNGWQSDDISGVFQFDTPYRYIALQAWSSSGPLNEPEIDAIAAVQVIPVPAAVWLFGTALIGLAGMSRRRNIR